MCWAVPSVVVRIEGEIVYVNAGDGVERPALNGIGEAVRPGDLVMVHAGVIIAKVDLATLRQSMEMWKEMARELATSTGDDPEAVAKAIEEEMWRVLKTAEEIAAGK
ncbi:MAG: HypC/HybG/HupF family hydrogenase formation chaperone [Pyrobaculum sp.]